MSSSWDEKCQGLKEKYEECFNHWLRTEFLTGKAKDGRPCSELFQEYQTCLRNGGKLKSINFEEATKDILGTDHEKHYQGDAKLSTEV